MKLPRLNLLGWLVAAAVAFLLAWAIVASVRLHFAQKAAADNALRASNAIAERDVSRKAMLSAADAVKILGDSLQAVERLAVQTPRGIARDRFDRATDRTSVVRGGVTVTTGPIHTTATSDSSSTSAAGDVRSASFHVDSSAARASVRFLADVRVDLPPPPKPGVLLLGVTFPAVTLQARQQCGPKDAAGVRPASLAIVAPLGMTVTVDRFEADVHGCNPDFGRPGGIRIPVVYALGFGLVTALATAVLMGR